MSIIILKQRCLESKANRKEFVRTPATNTCVTVCVISVRENTDNCLFRSGSVSKYVHEQNRTLQDRWRMPICKNTEDPDTIANVLFCNA